MACSHYEKILIEEDRHHINAPEYNNCVLCLAGERGPLTQEEIAGYFGLSKMRICQLEKFALIKFNKKMKKYFDVR